MSYEDADKSVKPSATDRLDATTREALAIIARETERRDAKTARLRMQRLAQEAADDDAAAGPSEDDRSPELAGTK